MAKIVKKGDVEKKMGVTGATRHPGIDMMPDSGGVIHKRVIDAGEKAGEILAKAEADAAHVRAEASRVLADAKKGREEEGRKGYKEGEAKGLAQVTEKLLDVEHLRECFYEGVEPEVIRLVMSIAEKIIGRLALENSELIRVVVRQALEKALGDRITVRVNPEDYKTIMAADHEFREVVDRTKRLMFREDDSISRGGCIVETEVGTIDAQLGTQLEAIRKAIVI